jgi:hypothetical protein
MSNVVKIKRRQMKSTDRETKKGSGSLPMSCLIGIVQPNSGTDLKCCLPSNLTLLLHRLSLPTTI